MVRQGYSDYRCRPAHGRPAVGLAALGTRVATTGRIGRRDRPRSHPEGPVGTVGSPQASACYWHMDADTLAHHLVDPHHHDGGFRGWVRPGGRRGRWLEPFLLRFVAEGEAHGRALITRLNELCLAPDGVDVGMAYRTLRELEAEGLVESTWVTNVGPPRRTYRLTDPGREALVEWIAVMRERARLIDAFLDGTQRLERGKGG